MVDHIPIEEIRDGSWVRLAGDTVVVSEGPDAGG